LAVGQFFSDEPGYYQAGDFGLRLETVLRVVEKKNLRFQDKDDYGTLLGFEPVCLVPFEPKLIKYELMNDEQIDWLNRYNRLIREKVGSELKRQGRKK
jgi:Xaa-Pro aminopeptidase